MKVAGVLMVYLAASVAAKNVFDFKKFHPDKDIDKRDAKNVINMDDLKIGVSDKRDDKGHYDKRDAKNVVDFKIKPSDKRHDIEVQHYEKRDAKNVVNFADFKHRVEQEQGAQKRDQVVMDTGNKNLLQSILPQFKSISIFAGYIRDNQEINHKTELADESMLVIAPTDNSIINKLNGMKPWEFPKSLDTEGADEDEVINSNLNYFIANHLTLGFNDLKVEQDTISVKLLSGKVIEILQDNAEQFKLAVDGNVIPVEMVKQVENGFIFIIDDCLIKPE